ncbi:MAG: 16S rRNA (cytidine(1402)-2'-O)-methyltransferase [Candidatus Latescibacterota bacterium]|nr:MAG: 16S rRNA (cytidine(1402)-2'-O)-methyltransferase [Candidatus Latescibacterota bacterium]
MDDSQSNTSTGTLILVSTPIGNLGDMTYRAVETLGNVSAILAEDTRHARKLLTHFDIQNELVPYHDHNKEKVTPGIIKRLRDGETLALVTDAGTPGVSDPGYYLVRAAVTEGVPVTVVPGANAILPALLLSGFPTDAFIFEGFLPRKKGELERKLSALEDERRTVVYFVSPHRLLKVLESIDTVLPSRRVAVAREITKLHEEVRRGTAKELIDWFTAHRVRGEFVLVISGRAKEKSVKKDKYK